MNVAFDPWIPVVTLSGERKLASLCEVFTDGSDFADLAIRPHERVSLMRLFLCVAHAALEGPKDSKEWKTVPKKLPQAARKYLKEWEDSFELFTRRGLGCKWLGFQERRTAKDLRKMLISGLRFLNSIPHLPVETTRLFSIMLVLMTSEIFPLSKPFFQC